MAEEVKDNTTVVRFSEPEKVIGDLAIESHGLTAETPKKYRLVMASLAAIRRVRTTLDKVKREIKSKPLQACRDIDAEYNRLYKMAEEVEAPLKAERAKADKAKNDAIQAELAEAKAKQQAIIEAELKAQADEYTARVKLEEAERKKAEEVLFAKMEAEAAKLKAEREELKAQQVIAANKLAAEQAKLNAIRRTEEANRKLVEEEQRLQLEMVEAKRAEEMKAMEKIRLEMEEKQKAAQVILDEQEATARAERERAEEAQRLATDRKARADFAKDVEVLRNYAKAYTGVLIPDVHSEQAKVLLADCADAMLDAMEPIWEAINDHKEATRKEEGETIAV